MAATAGETAGATGDDAAPEPRAQAAADLHAAGVRRINVSLDKALVDRIDAAATARGLTRSAFLAQAAREKIGG
jgi:hypothetical protein